LFLVHGAGGDVLWGYANLAGCLPADQPLYGLKSRGQVGLEEPTSIEEMAKCYLDEIRAFQAEGPYYLGGYCFGGNVAYEMARQLESQGQSVALLALLDSAPANAGYETMPWWRPDFAFRFLRNVYFWLEDFEALECRQRLRFIARKTRSFGRKFWRRVTAANESASVDVEEVIDFREVPARELRLWELHLRALAEHHERPYGGTAVLFRTRGQPIFCSLAKDFCWGRLVRRGIQVRLIPGSHENIFMEPNVHALARELQGCLSAPND
jgi:thioesterase domain-containing protein